MGFTRDAIQSRSTSPMDQLITARSAQMAAGVTVNQTAISGLPAMQSAVEFAAEAVAGLRMGVWRGRMPRVPALDTWQSRLFSESPNPLQGEFEFWHTLEASLEWRNSAFVWKTLDSKGRVIARTALHPGQVAREITGRNVVRYRCFFQEGYPIPPEVDGYGLLTDVGPENILHIRGRGTMGELMPLTPIQVFRKSLGLAIGKQEHEASLLENGAGYGLLATFPIGVSKDEADVWAEKFDAKHAGPSKVGRTKAIGGGATISNISMTQADAQFVESYELSAREVCWICQVPDWLLGVSVGKKSTRPAKPEHEMQDWRTYYLSPRLSRIESAFNHDPYFFGSGELYCEFDASDIVRGDLETEDRIAHQQIQDGRLLVDEWRIPRGKGPLPRVTKDTPPGMIPQITPVGGAPNPVTPTADSDVEDDD